MESEMIAHYRILQKLGSGGMGEVYKAQDTKLERVVALKLLPEDVVEDDDRVRRFIQEARAASALNHPNIITIHEVGQIGSETGSGETAPLHYIAMEYVEGSSLSEKIHRDGLDLRKLLELLAQAADGIAKAHAAGIVHRDLKPENIMVTDDGYVKILDFGIAKLIEPARPASGDLTEAATALMGHTRAGIVMGTAGYMSPEQAQGKAVDTRSDIFSFGSILYEAATRHRPFQGDSLIDSLHKIIYSPAPPLRDFNPAAPAELQRIVKKCLAKNPDERYQSIRDIAIDLRDLIKEYDSQPSVAATAAITAYPNTIPSDAQVSFPTSVNRDKRRWRRVAFGTAALILVIVAAFGLARLFGRKTARPLAPFQVQKMTRLTSTGRVTGAAISPDGKYIVHISNEAGQQSLWVRQVATGSTVQIISPSDYRHGGLTFSPDGNYIYYLRSERGSSVQDLYQVPVLGGATRKILGDVDSAITFSPDGKRFAFRRDTPHNGESGLVIANADGTGDTRLASRKLPDHFLVPDWSPDGRVIICSVGNLTGSRGHYTYSAVSVDDGAERPLNAGKWLNTGGPSWVSDGRSFIAAATDEATTKSQIWQFSYPGGEARRVTNDLNDYRGVSLTADSSTMITVQGDVTSSIFILPATGSESALQVTAGATKYDGAPGISWTPDGRIVYASRTNENNNIWIMNGDGSNRNQLTPNTNINFQPAVSPDGRYIVFASYREGAQSIWRMGIDGSNPVRLTSGGLESFPAFSPDGKWVVYTSLSTGKNSLWKVPVEGGEPAQIGDIFAITPAVSLDGKFVVCNYWSEEQGQPLRVAIIPFEGGQPVKVFNIPPGLVRWTPDGRGLTYVDDRGGASNLWIQPVAGGTPRQITQFKSDRIFSFAWSHDGKQIALARGVVNNDVVLISSQP